MGYYYYDVTIQAGCKSCGKVTNFPLESHSYGPGTYREIIGFDINYPTCRKCLEKHYSSQSIRDSKLEKLLKNWWEFWK